MKYEIIDKVSRFVKRFGMITDPETMNKASGEAGEYDFRLISKDHYAVIHKDKMYVIIERDGQISCSCDDMTFNRMDGSVCKHIIAFSRLMIPVKKNIDKLDATHLMHVCGWTGKELHPEEQQIPPEPEPTPKDSIPPDPDLDIGVDDPLPEQPEIPGKPEPQSNDVTVNKTDAPIVPEQKSEEKTNVEDKPAWDQEAWDNATQGSFVSYSEDGIAVVLFTDNDFEISIKPDKWGRDSYDFAVVQNKKAVVLSIGSIRLMNALKTILPLEGKTVKISRTGEGTGTKYEVQDVTDTEVI